MELIRNGYFETGDLDPWSACGDMALEGGVTHAPDNPVYCSANNLKLIGNDCVRQDFERPAIVTEGGLSLWVRWLPMTDVSHVSSAEAGDFEARVEYYGAGEHDAVSLDLDALLDRGATMLDPLKLTVGVAADQEVTAVRLRCAGSSYPWYISGVTLEGQYVDSGSGAGAGRKVGAGMDERLHRLERRVAKLERLLTLALSTELRPVVKHPRHKEKGGREKKASGR